MLHNLTTDSYIEISFAGNSSIHDWRHRSQTVHSFDLFKVTALCSSDIFSKMFRRPYSQATTYFCPAIIRVQGFVRNSNWFVAPGQPSSCQVHLEPIHVAKRQKRV